MRLSAAIERPRPEDVGQAGRLGPVQWTEVCAVAAAEISRRARPALVSYLALVGLAAWGSGALRRWNPRELCIVIAVGAGLLVAGLLRHGFMGRPNASLRWWRGFGALTICNAVLIGVLGAAMTVHHRLAFPALVYWLVLAGTGAGAAMSLIPSPVLGRVFLWLSLAPLTIAALWVATGTSYALPAIFAIFLVFMTGQAARGSRNYWEGVISEVLLRDQAKALDGARLEAQLALAAQNGLVAQLSAHREDAERDYAVAARVFGGIVERSCFKLQSLRATLSPVERFNGDLVMAACAGGRLRLLLGDFTGHGLAAAVGALPIAEAFFSGAARGISLTDVLNDMNGLIRRNLPRGMFLTAFIAEVHPESGRLIFWNGGLPSPFVLGRAGQVQARLVSQDVALGVLPAGAFNPVPQEMTIRRDDRIFVYSDGVTETANAVGDLFGDARLVHALGGETTADFRSDDVCRALLRHREGVQNADDVTLLELRNDDLLVAEVAALGRENRGANPLALAL